MDTDQINKLLKGLSDIDIVIMSGLPGSGKSYYANKLSRKFGHSYLSTDVIRTSKIATNQEKYTKSSKEYLKIRDDVYQQLHQTLVKRLNNGKKVVVDATYLGPQRDQLIQILKENHILNKAVFVVVKVDQRIIESRIQTKKLENGQKYTQKWKIAYKWFSKNLAKGIIRYPDEQRDGVKVIEVWNDEG